MSDDEIDNANSEQPLSDAPHYVGQYCAITNLSPDAAGDSRSQRPTRARAGPFAAASPRPSGRAGTWRPHTGPARLPTRMATSGAGAGASPRYSRHRCAERVRRLAAGLLQPARPGGRPSRCRMSVASRCPAPRRAVCEGTRRSAAPAVRLACSHLGTEARGLSGPFLRAPIALQPITLAALADLPVGEDCPKECPPAPQLPLSKRVWDVRRFLD